MSQAARTDAQETGWNTLYRIGAAAALFPVLIIPIQLAVFTSSPPPETALDWFNLFQENRLLGLLSFEILFVFSAILGLLTVAALYVALRRSSPSLMAVVLALTVVGSISLIVARPALDMLSLSERYAAATDGTQQAMYLAAGEMLLATYNGTAFHVSYNLANIAYILVAVVILKETTFSRVTAYAALLAGVIGFGLYLPEIGLSISVLSVLFLAVYQVLVAVRLFRLSQASASEA
jgi:hypothetical protein